MVRPESSRPSAPARSIGVAALVAAACAQAAQTRSPAAGAGELLFTIDAQRTSPISPYIYGLNFAEQGGGGTSTKQGGGIWGSFLPRYTLNRFGGNRLSGHSWETGDSNCGNDCGARFPNDDNLLANVGSSAGVGRSLAPRVDSALAAHAAMLVTVPLIGFVARDASGDQPIPRAPSNHQPATPSAAHWLQALPRDPAGPRAAPDTRDDFTYSDDLARWLQTNYPQADLQYELDNEPDLWFSTHPEIRGTTDGLAVRADNRVGTSFEELIEKTAAHAQAIKAAAPRALLWAGAFATWDGLVALNYPTHEGPPAGYTYYFDRFLEGLRAAGHGARLVDVVDVHWYAQDGSVTNDYLPQTPAVIDAREQAPRSLWDPAYVESSWVAQAMPPGDPLTRGCRGRRCPVQLLPRLQSRIDQFFPGTRLAIGEYWYGRGGDISGAIAEADALGIFGRSGLFAAALWPNGGIWTYSLPAGCNGAFVCTATRAYACALRALDVYRNFDGAGSSFGDTSLAVERSDPAFTDPRAQSERATVYASADAKQPERVVLVAINKTQEEALRTAFHLEHAGPFAKVEVWQMSGSNGGAGGCTGLVRQADLPLSGPASFFATLPAQSISVLVLRR